MSEPIVWGDPQWEILFHRNYDTNVVRVEVRRTEGGELVGDFEVSGDFIDLVCGKPKSYPVEGFSLIG